MRLTRRDARVVGVGFVVLAAGSAIAVGVDTDSSTATVGLAALLGVAAGLGVAQIHARRRHGAAPRRRSEPVSMLAALAVLVAASAAWVLLGAATADVLDDAGFPMRSELFLFADGLVAAFGILLLRSTDGAARE